MVPFLSLAFLFPQITSQEVGIGCFVQAECVGATSTGIAHAMNANDCYDLCSSIPDCNFFTFYSEGNYCFSYSNCPSVNKDCEDCISGMKVNRSS